MKKFIKKICILNCMIACFALSYQVVAHASSISFSKWYSDANQVGYWSQAPKVYFSNLSGTMNVSTYVNKAVNKWSSAGISSSVTTTPSNATIKFYGGKRSELVAIGFYYDSTTNGKTDWDSYSTAATANGGCCSIKKLSAVSASVCSEADSSLYTHVVLHEYGHALGWAGHSDKSSDVMYGDSTAENTTLTNRDKKQLTQVYDVMN